MQLSTYRVRGLVIIIVSSLAFIFVLQIYRHNKHHKENDEYKVYLPALLSAAIDLAETGGYEVKAVHLGANIGVKSKGETDEGAQEFVTQADRRSHMKIVAGLKLVWPSLYVISEERDKVNFQNVAYPDLDRSEIKKWKDSPLKTDFVDIQDLTVWVDPLDATQEYTENLLQYVTVMVCVADKGTPIMGVVHQPFEGKTYYAWVGNGNNLPNHNHHSDSENIKIIVSRSHAGDVETLVKNKIKGNVEVIQAGGAGYKTLQVLGGVVDYYIHVTKIKKWDICAPNAMLAAVHGSMTTLKGESINYSREDGSANNDGLFASLQERGNPELLRALSSN